MFCAFFLLTTLLNFMPTILLQCIVLFQIFNFLLQWKYNAKPEIPLGTQNHSFRATTDNSIIIQIVT